MSVVPLPANQLTSRCLPEVFAFRSSQELVASSARIEQTRAVRAIEFAMAVDGAGFNLFVMGPPGSGRHTLVSAHLAASAAQDATPADWCYVHNFEQPHKPDALRFPPGVGQRFSAAMAQLLEDLKSTVPALFEGEDYQTRRHGIEAEVKQRQDDALNALRDKAREQGVAFMSTPGGFAFAPLHDGEVMAPDMFHKLDDQQREQIEQRVGALQKELQETVRQFPVWMKEARRRIKQLDREVTRSAVEHLIEAVAKEFGAVEEVSDYLDRLLADVVENAELFRGAPEGMPPFMPASEPPLERYQVNLLVTHGEAGGAPVIFADHPSYANLIGRIEHQAQFGALRTDFTLIKPGLLHEANGGYLVIDAARLLLEPFAWDVLKRTLRSRELRLEPLDQRLSLISTVSLEPEPIPISVKVVLIGDRYLYYLLSQLDPDFSELFKVVADFDDQVHRTPENVQRVATTVAQLADSAGLRPLDPGGMARVVEHAARLVGDAQRLSTRISAIRDLLVESDHYAGRAGTALIGAQQVQAAIDALQDRNDRVRVLAREQVLRETVLIDTAGAKVGQINGLSVLQLGATAFGKPTRISARVRPGNGRVLDIEREVELGGALHSKGVLILASFLGARYAAAQPLALAASLVFEQSYGGVDGDSASSTELYALISALAEVPITQGLAVTGSVNQLGEVQAIGGVNEKIEGFFDICAARGLSGDQGVLIPAANVKHLMLRADIVAAAEAGQFHIFPVAHIDEGIELLMGRPAGGSDEQGNYPPDSVNGMVQRRLEAFAEIRSRVDDSGRMP